MRRALLTLVLAAPSVAYAGVTPALYEGELLPGDSVKVKDGMVFVVSATDKS